MLMMCREDLIVDDRAVWRTLFVQGLMDGLGGQDSCCTDFEMDICCLSELPGLQVSNTAENEGVWEGYKDVFVVCDGDDCLDDEDTGTDDGSNVGTIIGMFPTNTTILFMQTDRILHLQRGTILI